MTHPTLDGIFTIPPFLTGARAANCTYSEAPASAPTMLAECPEDGQRVTPTALPAPPPMPILTVCAFEGELARAISLVPPIFHAMKQSTVTQLRLAARPSIFPSLPPRAA